MIEPPSQTTIIDQADRKVLAAAWVIGLSVCAFLLIVAVVAGLMVRIFSWVAWG